MIIKQIEMVALLMVANTLFKVGETFMNQTFDLKELFKGIVKYLFILIGVIAVAYAGSLAPEIQIGDVTILQMLQAIGWAIIVKYVDSCRENLMSIFNIGKESYDAYKG